MNYLVQKFKIVFLLLRKDLKESLQNRTALIVIFLPLFASLMFSVVNSQQLVRNFEIGITGQKSSSLQQFVADNYSNIKFKSYRQFTAGKRDAAAGKIDALIVYEQGQTNSNDHYQIYLDSRDTINFFILKENITDLLQQYYKLDNQLNLEFAPVTEFDSVSSILPIWITVTITMIGLMLISGSLAKEKDNKTLAALLVTRVNIWQLIAAKSLLAVILSLITAFLMGLLNNLLAVGFASILLFILTVFLAALTFSALGLLIAFISGSQAATRSISTIIYFPIIFPALIADLSPLTQKLASFFPSYYLYQALDKLLVYRGNQFAVLGPLVSLSLFALLFYFIIYFYLRKADTIAD